jgi:hypothetical protein
MQQALLQKLTVAQLVKKSLVFYGSGMFIKVFTRTLTWFLPSQLNPMNAISHV